VKAKKLEEANIELERIPIPEKESDLTKNIPTIIDNDYSKKKIVPIFN